MLSEVSSECGPRKRIRYAILGDIHANLEALTAVLKDAQERQCTHHACTGDVVGYNPNPRECLDIIRAMGMPCVKGNHDEYCSTDIPLENFSARAAAAALWTRNNCPRKTRSGSAN
jgi:predicted phosphodiesterase